MNGGNDYPFGTSGGSWFELPRSPDSEQSQQAPPLSVFPPLSSPLSGHHSLTGASNPRDYHYLGPRADAPPLRSPMVVAANPRSLALSPLHTSFGPLSIQQVNPDYTQSSPSPKSTSSSRSLPNHQSDGRVGCAGIPPSPASSVQISIDQSATSHQIAQTQHVGDMAENSSAKLNRIQLGSPVSTPSINPSLIFPDSQQSSSGDGTVQRSIPRASSIDSAISSLSYVSNAVKSSFDASTLSTSDISQLISAAGSAEAVILHLLKEKHHTAAQNSQLWRLVDKQRSLILGLHKDLERAFKEKEKYKKKIKELQTSTQPLPQAARQNIVSRLRNTEQNVSNQESSFWSVEQAQVSSSRQNLRIQFTDRQSGDSIELDSADRTVGGEPLEPRWNDSRILESSENVFAPSQSPVLEHPAARGLQKLAMRADTPSSDSTAHDFLRIQGTQTKIPQPSRKPPPAPLTLVQAERSAPGPSLYDSESDNEHILGRLDDLSGSERGRRKTREEDDTVREVELVREQASHGLSKQTAISKFAEDNHGANEIVPPTASPANSSHNKTIPPPLAGNYESLALPAHPQRSYLSSGHDGIMAAPPRSPGLPVSPRPGDRPLGSPLPRQARDHASAVYPAPTSPVSGTSELLLSTRDKNLQQSSQGEIAQISSKAGPSVLGAVSGEVATRPVPAIDTSIKIDSPSSPQRIRSGIHHGLISDSYPSLLLPPNALPLIQVKVFSSRLRPSRNSYLGPRPTDEEPVFTLSVISRSDNRELWRVEKIIAALPQLDQQIRQHCNVAVKVPDRTMFSGHSPVKVDARRAALNSYFDVLLDTPMDEKAAVIICQFLTADAIEPRDDETELLKNQGSTRPEVLRGPDGKPRKEGWLTKRGKNFGGWKPRYFLLHGPELKYFEAPGGAHMGTIKIYNAQIGKQLHNTSARTSSPSRVDDEPDNQYRHAFLILEPKKKDSSALVRHVLCAESDEERDAWVEALLEYVESNISDVEDPNGMASTTQLDASAKPTAGVKGRLFPHSNKKAGKGIEVLEVEAPGTIQGFSYEDAVAAEPPILGTSLDSAPSRLSQKMPVLSVESVDGTGHNNSPFEHKHPFPKSISGPTNGTVIQDAGAWGNKAVTPTKEKKRSIWGFRTRSSIDLASQLQGQHENVTVHASLSNVTDRRDPVRPVFGIPLGEAVLYCGPQGVDSELPAVVYRCIEYLKAKEAASEEGIFRLSGSNAVVKALKERFNNEGDVNFLADDQYYDVHAVASLFKQYLRELPTTVLTRELHLDFLRVLELDEKQQKISAFNTLVHKLPRPNFALLRALAGFLLGIVNNSDVNKMTVRNVGIVFAPTLNIPAPVFSMFLTDYDSIFGGSRERDLQPAKLPMNPLLSPNDVRSPRHQMFSYIPTPDFSQISFPNQEDCPIPENNNPNSRTQIGFVPMHPSYEQATYASDSGIFEQEIFCESTTNRALAPTDVSRSSRAKRRESSLLLLDVGNRRNSAILPLSDNHALVTEEPLGSE